MSNSIWHKRDETPKDFCDVVLADSRTGSYCVFLSPFHDLSFNYDRWCYFDELLAQADKAERLQKAQEDLKCAEEELECVKHNYSVLSEQKEIAYQNYLKITDDLQKQLKQVQDALKEIKETVDAFKDSEFAEDMRDCVRTISQILASIPTEKDK